MPAISMDNRIQQIIIADHSLTPAQAEVRITVVPEQHTPTPEVRGRLMGPRCLYAATIEVAYPLRPLSTGQQPMRPGGITQRAIIPEASLWEPQSPFLYQGPIELWQDGQRCDQRTICHGLRSLRLTERGLLLNGRPLSLDGTTGSVASDEDALALRQAGCNLLIAPVETSTLSQWERADRLGFLMLGVITEDSLPNLGDLSTHASCLGWLVDVSASAALPSLRGQGIVGLMCETPPDEQALSAVHFLCGPAELANLGKPLLVRGEETPLISERGLALGRVR